MERMYHLVGSAVELAVFCCNGASPKLPTSACLLSAKAHPSVSFPMRLPALALLRSNCSIRTSYRVTEDTIVWSGAPTVKARANLAVYDENIGAVTASSLSPPQSPVLWGKVCR